MYQYEKKHIEINNKYLLTKTVPSYIKLEI